MPLIFIDASIYLGFWKVADGRLSTELLPATVSLGPHIFISQQTSNEISRRKLDAFVSAAGFSKPKLPREFPEHLLSDEGAARWRIARDRLLADFDRLAQEWSDRADQLAEKISRSEDPASVALAAIVANAVEATGAQLERARLRRERGNPPGKQGDKLGDQITWEQVLHAASGQELWLVAGDNDFGLVKDDVITLNPLLLSELTSRDIEVRTFSKLATLIREAERAGLRVQDAPAPERLEELAKEATVPSRQHVTYGTGSGPCPVCGNGHLVGPGARPGPFGFAWYSSCTKCGALIFVDDYCG